MPKSIDACIRQAERDHERAVRNQQSARRRVLAKRDRAA